MYEYPYQNQKSKQNDDFKTTTKACDKKMGKKHNI